MVLAKVRLYGRVSTKDQVSTTTQLDEIRPSLKDKIIDMEVTEEKTATDKKGIYDPIEYMKLRQEFYNKCWLPAGEYDELWVWKWDRFSRSDFQPILIRMFRDRGVTVFAFKDSNEPIVRDIQGVLSKEEIRKIKERVDLRHNELVNQGKLINRLPYGYKPVKKIVKGKIKIVKWVIDEKEASIVRIIHTMKGNPVKSISEKVGLPYTTVCDILKNKAYFGIQTYKGKEYKCNEYEPILKG